MCSIIQLQPGYTLPYNMLQNAVWNNPHGYGLIVKKKKKLEIIKELPVEGNDPQKIYELLKKHESGERFLHVRWKTQGDVSELNIHPFKVFEHKGREVWFMHNGTLNNYGPSNYQHGTNTPQKSDSRKFADTVLEPILSKVVGENGLGDYEDPTVQEIIEKFWSYGNKGVLISNDLDPYFLGKNNWTVISTKEEQGGKEVTGSFYASNNEYFSVLKRGPVFDKLKEEREVEEREKRLAAVRSRPTQGDSSLPDGITPLSCPAWSERFSVSDDIQDICEDSDLYNIDGYIGLANLTWEEMKALVEKSPEGCATLLFYLTDFLKSQTLALEKVQEKKKDGETVIAKLKHQIDALQIRVEELMVENVSEKS